KRDHIGGVREHGVAFALHHDRKRRRDENRVDAFGSERLDHELLLPDPQKLDLFVRVDSEMLEQQTAADLVRAADAHDADDAAFQLLDAFYRRLDHQAEKRRFDAVREGADGRAARRRADRRPEHLDIIDVAAEERGDIDGRTRLYELGRET